MDLLKITLKSDLCAGNGSSFGNTVDSDLVVDAFGLPVIPARRLKGCLRQAAELLEQAGAPIATPENITALFGNRFGSEGALWIQDAQLWYADSAKAYLTQNRKDAFTSAANLRDLYCQVRGQTRIEEKTGIADGGSLRYTRVLKHYDPVTGGELELFAPIGLNRVVEQPVRKLLVQCCRAVRHIGSDRNRGLGNVSLELTETPANEVFPQPALPAEGMVELRYRMMLDAPITLPGVTELETAIPARSIIGCMAAQYLKQGSAEDAAFTDLFLNGTARWSAATPMIGGKISAAAPLMLAYLKTPEDNSAPRYINRLAGDEKGKKKTVESCYAARQADGFAVASVQLATGYHHQHDHIARAGKPGPEDMEATLYMQTALQPGVEYGGTVTLPASLAPAACKLLHTAALRFGRSRSAQYAACHLAAPVQAALAEAHTVTAAPGEAVYVVLQSDLVLVEESTGLYTTENAAVRAALAAALGVADALPQGTMDYTLCHVVGGYQSTWQLQKPRLPAVRAGSVFCFTAHGGTLPAALQLGELAQEGFGCCAVYTASQMVELTQVRRAEVDHAVAIDGNRQEMAALETALLLQQSEDAMLKTAFALYKERASALSRMDTGLLGRLRLMVLEAESPEDLRRRVSSIKTNGKRKNAQCLLRYALGEDQLTTDLLLRGDAAVAEKVKANPAAAAAVVARWKLPLQSALHLAYYNKNARTDNGEEDDE